MWKYTHLKEVIKVRADSFNFVFVNNMMIVSGFGDTPKDAARQWCFYGIILLKMMLWISSILNEAELKT